MSMACFQVLSAAAFAEAFGDRGTDLAEHSALKRIIDVIQECYKIDQDRLNVSFWISMQSTLRKTV